MQEPCGSVFGYLPGSERTTSVIQKPDPSSGSSIELSSVLRSMTNAVMKPDGNTLPLKLKPTKVPVAPKLYSHTPKHFTYFYRSDAIR